MDVGHGGHVALEGEGQAVGQDGGHHEEGRDVLRTDGGGNADAAAGHVSPFDAQRGEAVLPEVVNAGAEAAQGLDQQTDRPLLHTRRARQGVAAAVGGSEQGGEEAHGGAGGADIDFVGTMLEGVEQHAGVVTLRQSADMAVVGQYRQDQGAGGKALRRRQLKAGVDMAWQG